MPTRILHVSDLHVGARDDDVLERALAGLAGRVSPTLVIASGDLTYRGRRDQHECAGTVLRNLGLPVLAVPGNHDIPYSFPARSRAVRRVRGKGPAQRSHAAASVSAAAKPPASAISLSAIPSTSALG